MTQTTPWMDLPAMMLSTETQCSKETRARIYGRPELDSPSKASVMERYLIADNPSKASVVMDRYLVMWSSVWGPQQSWDEFYLENIYYYLLSNIECFSENFVLFCDYVTTSLGSMSENYQNKEELKHKRGTVLPWGELYLDVPLIPILIKAKTLSDAWVIYLMSA